MLPVCLIRITKIIVSNAHDWGWLWSAASNAPKRIVAYAIYREEDVIIHWKTPHVRFIALAYQQ